MKTHLSAGLMLFAVLFVGCRGDVKETPDSVKVEVEVPKVEIGNKAPDANPRTDDDVDVDTPIPGDR